MLSLHVARFAAKEPREIAKTKPCRHHGSLLMPNKKRWRHFWASPTSHHLRTTGLGLKDSRLLGEYFKLILCFSVGLANNTHVVNKVYPFARLLGADEPEPENVPVKKGLNVNVNKPFPQP